MLRRFSATELSSRRLYLVTLAVVFICEFAVMLVLPMLPLKSAPEWVVGLVDSCLLTLLLAPVLWLFIIRPLQQMAQVRSRLLEEFIGLQEEERRRIARDLHDEIGQSFTSVLIGMRTMDRDELPPSTRERLQELMRIVTETLREVRRIARGLRPGVLDHLGLSQAVHLCLEDFRSNHSIVVDEKIEGFDNGRRCPSAIETAVYRIVQESLTNISRHANADRVRLTLSRDSSSLSLDIEDNGRGFGSTSSRHSDAPWSGGIRGMTERAALLKGMLRVDSKKGTGTRVSLRLPLTKDAAG